MLRDPTIGLLQRHGLRVEAALDEQQLVDPDAINALIEASGVNLQDTILEIGPGTGNITVELAKKAKKVFALEKNPKFLPLLNERLIGGGNTEIILGDALAVPLPVFDVLVSNLPYAIAEAVFQRLKRMRFRAASLIVPSSLASTLTSKNGETNYSKLAFEAHLFFDVAVVAEVKPKSYYPEPNTETTIIVLKPRESIEPVESVMRHLLQQGDKKVLNAIREAFIASSAEGYPSTKRAAREAIDRLRLSESILEKKVARLSLADVELIFSRLEHNAD